MTINILKSFDLSYKPKSLTEYINESFYAKGWQSLETDSTLLLDNTTLSNTVIEILARMFGQEDIKGLVFCSHDTGMGVDFHSVHHKIHELKPCESKVKAMVKSLTLISLMLMALR